MNNTSHLNNQTNPTCYVMIARNTRIVNRMAATLGYYRTLSKCYANLARHYRHEINKPAPIAW